jgi:hypothetical protein
MHIGARGFLVISVLLFSGTASWSDDDDPLTQQHVRSITETALAPGHTEKAEPPQSIEPLSKEDRKALKETHRVISGKTWRSETPEQRDEHIRNLRDANPPNTIFVIDVRTGDVYKFDPLPQPQNPNQSKDAQLSEIYKVRISLFTPLHMIGLPVAVGNSTFSQSDRGSEFAARPVEPVKE